MYKKIWGFDFKKSGLDFWYLKNIGKTMFILQEILKYEHIGFLGFLKSRTEPDRTETGRFDSVSVFFLYIKKTDLVVFCR